MAICVSKLSFAAKLLKSATIVFEHALRKIDQIDLVHRQHHMADAQQRNDIGVAARLREHALARIDQNDGELRIGGARRHVPRVLLVAGRVGDDEFSLVGREEPVGDIDGDALLAFRLQPIHQKGQIDVLAGGAVLAGILGEGRQMIFEDQLGIEKQPADQGRLAVIHAAAGEEAQQRFLLLLRQIGFQIVELHGLHQK